MTETPNVTSNVNKRDVAKWLANQVVSRSVGTTIGLIVKQNVKPEKKRHVLYIGVGAYVLGDMIGELTEPYVNKQVDETIEMAQKAKAFVNKLKDRK